MIGSVVLYAGLLAAAAGAISLAWPLRFIGIMTRSSGAMIFVLALLAIIIVMVWPAREKRSSSGQTRLDEVMPVWQFDERHATHVDAPPEKVFAAIRSVRAEDILFFSTLAAIRRGWSRRHETILNPAANAPILDVATRTSFRYLADDPPREVVIGAAVAPNAFATMNFLVVDDGRGGSDLSTETRVDAKTQKAGRRFAMYWRAIRPGSDIIRRMWLRAITKRAEAK